MPLSERATIEKKDIITRHPDVWQRQAAAAITDPLELLRLLALDDLLDEQMLASARDFPLRVTQHFATLMQAGDPTDPLLRQVLPIGVEGKPQPGFVDDPVGDTKAYVGQGLLQKYHGRALLIATGACAIHCRYCFRRHYPYSDRGLTRSEREQMLQQLATMDDVHEVILSGGDPLSLPDRMLAPLLADLAALPHIKRIRIHTRQPVVLPARVTPALIAALALPVPVVLVLHVNHARELSPELVSALLRIRQTRPHILNQSVLLRGVNDTVDTLAELSEALFEAEVLPYYLHQLDPVAGAAHFAVPDAEARQLHQRLQSRLPGYLVPRLVREIAGQPGKTPL